MLSFYPLTSRVDQSQASIMIMWTNQGRVLPGHDDAEAGGADPGGQHEGAVQEDEQPRLGLEAADLAEAAQRCRDHLLVVEVHVAGLRVHAALQPIRGEYCACVDQSQSSITWASITW